MAQHKRQHKGSEGMHQTRYQGTLKQWNAERGFGFITEADGGQDIFVHITAFARDGSQPHIGEVLSFAIEPDRNGKRSAVRVQRAGDPTLPAARAAAPPRQPRMVRSSRSSLGQKIFVLVLLVLVGIFGYSRYDKSVRQIEADAPRAIPSQQPSTLFESPITATPKGFTCDGRTQCSQMTSCKEAKFFLQNCPGTTMDGNHDGTPCEQQWCTSPFAE